METIQFECRKDGLRQTQDGGLKLSLSIHPDDVTPELLTAAMGQQFMAVLAPVDGGEPVRLKRKWHELKLSEQAGILSSKKEFQEWAGMAGADYIRSKCDVTSRSDIKEGTEAGRKFMRLMAEYLHDTNDSMENA